MTPTIKVICIDDLPDQSELVKTSVNHANDMKCIGVFENVPSLLGHLANIEMQRGQRPESLMACDQWPDVIVVDWMMPNVNGQLALELISRRWPFIKLIVYSARSSDEIMDSARDAGAVAVLQKTGGMPPLLAAIRRAGGHEMINA